MSAAQPAPIQLPDKTQQIIAIGHKAIEMGSDSVTKQITGTMNAIGSIAQKGTIIFLQSFGAALILLCIATKIKLGTYELSTLTHSEYIVTVFGGLLFILAGSAIRFYILKVALEEERAISQAGRDIMKSQAEAANGQIEIITKASTEAAQHHIQADMVA